MSLGDRLRQRREEKGINGVDLSRRANISKGFLSEIESGRAPRPSADVLFRLATALGTTVADLLEKEVQRPALTIPPSLKQFLDEAKEPIPQEDIEMLAGIHFRGNQPATADDWRFLYESIRRSIRPGQQQ